MMTTVPKSKKSVESGEQAVRMKTVGNLLSDQFIRDVDLCVRKIPLLKPYRLSFGVLHEFSAIICRIHLNGGKILTGEVTPLHGYSNDTIESVLNKAKDFKDQIKGLPLEDVRKVVWRSLTGHACIASLFLTAIDSLFLELEFTSSCQAVPLVYTVSSANPNFEMGMAEGYRTFKVKVGSDIQDDLDMLRQLQSFNSGASLKIRFDANQNYSFENAIEFVQKLEKLEPGLVEYLEQPFRAHAWQQHARLRAETSIPVMLDESIYTRDDVDRAARYGFNWIKLKLYKQGGIQELLDLAAYARQKDINVVLGNGVATDISNLLELTVYHLNRDLFSGACESNGFAKIVAPLCSDYRLDIRNGAAFCRK